MNMRMDGWCDHHQMTLFLFLFSFADASFALRCAGEREIVSEREREKSGE